VFLTVYQVSDSRGLLLKEREKDRVRFQRPSDSARDIDRGGASVPSGGRIQDVVSGALGVMNMASNMMGGGMGGAMNLAGGSLNIQLLSQLGIDPSAITNQVFVANVSCSLFYSLVYNLFIIYHIFATTMDWSKKYYSIHCRL